MMILQVFLIKTFILSNLSFTVRSQEGSPTYDILGIDGSGKDVNLLDDVTSLKKKEPQRKNVKRNSALNYSFRGARSKERNLPTSKFNLPPSSGIKMTDARKRFFTKKERNLSASKFNLPPSSDIKMTDARKRFFTNFEKRHDYKTKRIWTTDAPGDQPVLSSFHYIIMPMWWSEMDTTDPNNEIDPNQITTIMTENQNYYDEMSFGKIDVSFGLVDQEHFDLSRAAPSLGEAKTETKAKIDTLGYEKETDFDGYILVYYGADSGNMNNGGGWGDVNSGDSFTWMQYTIGFAVTRHEVGHNFGHPHHETMRSYRLGGDTTIHDGFDMMSGGNGYDISHFHVSSKWWYGWVPDENIVMLQPEGSTDMCPNCVSDGTFLLKTFDDSTSPPANGDVFGIHIPIIGSGSGKTYAYWLQYRTGNDGKASGGLSVHLVWFSLGNTFGASTDSLNYDAYGDTSSMLDSFVTPNSCYVIEPAQKLMEEEDALSVEQIIPKVCVDSIDVGNSITVSVSFLEASVMSPPPPPPPTQAPTPNPSPEPSPEPSPPLNPSADPPVGVVGDDTSAGDDEPSTDGGDDDCTTAGLFLIIQDIVRGRQTVTLKNLHGRKALVANTDVVFHHNPFTCTTSGVTYDASGMNLQKRHLYHFKGAGIDGVVNAIFCPDTSSAPLTSTAYFYDNYPVAPLDYGSPLAYGSHASVSFTWIDCCTPGSTLPSNNKASVVLIRNNNDPGHIHLREIEVYNPEGVNVALDGTCYSGKTAWGGDPACLNDGDLAGCNSHSASSYQGFDFCVLAEPTTISRINITPASSWISRLGDIKLEVYAGIMGVESVTNPKNAAEFVTFYGLLYEEDFGFSNYQALDLVPTLASSYECLARSEEPEEFSFDSKLTNTWVLLTEQTKELTLGCQMATCARNQYLSGDTCEMCPDNTLSDEGSTTVEDCEPCYDGYETTHPLSTSCTLSPHFDTTINTSNGWRIMFVTDETDNGWKADVEYMEFRTSQDCDPLSAVDTTDGTPIESGNAGGDYWSARHAFVDNTRIWGGRRYDGEIFFVGMTFPSPDVSVKCLYVRQGDVNIRKLRVQALTDVDTWSNVYIKEGLDTNEFTFSW